MGKSVQEDKNIYYIIRMENEEFLNVETDINNFADITLYTSDDLSSCDLIRSQDLEWTQNYFNLVKGRKGIFNSNNWLSGEISPLKIERLEVEIHYKLRDVSA